MAPEIIKRISCSNQLSMKFILLINVKMPTIVGLLTFNSRIKTSESFKARKIFIIHSQELITNLRSDCSETAQMFFKFMKNRFSFVVACQVWYTICKDLK